MAFVYQDTGAPYDAMQGVWVDSRTGAFISSIATRQRLLTKVPDEVSKVNIDFATPSYVGGEDTSYSYGMDDSGILGVINSAIMTAGDIAAATQGYNSVGLYPSGLSSTTPIVQSPPFYSTTAQRRQSGIGLIIVALVVWYFFFRKRGGLI